MPACPAGMLIGGNQVCDQHAATPHLGLKRFNKSLDSFFAVSALSPELRRLAVFDERQEASVCKNTLHSVVHHVVWYDALLWTRDCLRLSGFPDNSEIIELTTALHKDQFHAPKFI